VDVISWFGLVDSLSALARTQRTARTVRTDRVRAELPALLSLQSFGSLSSCHASVASSPPVRHSSSARADTAIMISMSTKLEIDDDLVAAAEQEASRRGQTLSTFVEQALRDACAHSPEDLTTRRVVELPTFRGRGLRPGVNLDDSAALLELMESSDDSA
jgi:hypothetical protein